MCHLWLSDHVHPHVQPAFPVLDNNTLWHGLPGCLFLSLFIAFCCGICCTAFVVMVITAALLRLSGPATWGSIWRSNCLRAPWLGIRVAGFYDDHKSGNIALEEAVVPGQTLPVLGELEQLVIDAKGGAIDRIYITLPMRYEKRIHELVTALSDTTCSVLLVPYIFTFNLLHSRASALNGIPLISIFDTPMLCVNQTGGRYCSSQA